MARVHRLRPEAVAWRRIDDEVVILDVAEEAYLAANTTGALLWETLADGATEDDLVELLTSRFDVTGEQARRDVSDFLASLAERDLLEVVDRPEPAT